MSPSPCLQQDESLATEVNDLIQDRLRTFLYSRRQGEIAGVDGELGFNRVFGEEARVVTVLYRNGWGQTPWTRIEETAIRNRAYNDGYDFSLFIPLDEPVTMPKWLPKTQIWFDLRRWGPKGAAAIIEKKAQEGGAQAREESVQDRAARFRRDAEFQGKRKQFLTSEAGVRAANESAQTLCNDIQRLTTDPQFAALGIAFKRTGLYVLLLGGSRSFSVGWRNQWANTLDGSELRVSLWKGHPPFPGIIHFEEPRELRNHSFKFELRPDGQTYWREQSAPAREFDVQKLAEHILKEFMDELQHARIEENP